MRCGAAQQPSMLLAAHVSRGACLHAGLKRPSHQLYLFSRVKPRPLVRLLPKGNSRCGVIFSFYTKDGPALKGSEVKRKRLIKDVEGY